jgi:hypothetical protein
VQILYPGWEINGGYWQWGRKVQAAPGPVGFNETNSNVVVDWNTESSA